MSWKVANWYIPAYENLNLPWYERDFHQLKYKEFIVNLHGHFSKVKVINFDIIHNECSDKPLENSVKH